VPFTRDAVIRDYHRQNMFLATNPLVDIVAHPWWWMGHWKDDNDDYPAEPWFDDFGVIPKSIHDEFAAAAVEHGTAVEINISANLLNPHYPAHFAEQYLAYLAGLQSQGVTLSIGSDCHSEHYEFDFAKVETMLREAGISGDFWRLPTRDAAV
jgi:histidinol phosphatase-like PHP family hydrolase